MKKETKLIGIIFIIALIVRIIFLFSSPLKIWDETVYANLGYDLSKNPFDYSFANNGWSDFIPSNEENYSWPKAGFRAPFLPYILLIFYFLKLDFLISFFIPFIGALSILFVFFLGKKLFNKKVGIYSAIFLTFLPLHVVYSGKILTDILVTLLIILTFLFFWKGFEENKNKYKILFGFFLALALLTKYTTLWIIPIFLLYFLFKKNFRFLKDKYLWLSVLVFFLTLTIWFIYSYFEYGNLIGAFIHGAKSASYWGGTQPWYFFFQYIWNMFSIIGIIFILSILFIFYKKEFVRKEIYLVLIWVFLFLLIAILMPHKEDRFILPIVPAICLLSGFFINKIRKYKKIIFVIIIIILFYSLFFNFYNTYQDSYTESSLCFLQANKFLNTVEKNAVVITDESPIIYFYSKKETHFYPSPWSLNALNNLAESYPNKSVYVFFTVFDMSLNEPKNIQIEKDLETSSDKIFLCSLNQNSSRIYKIK